jgi:sugar-specific transcriptional regulator TrmB
MVPDSTERTVAIERLQHLGLSTYAARTFVALVALDGGTAEDVSDVAEVPRTRVYDAVTELEDAGLVDVQHSTPKQFWPVSAETTGRHFERQYLNHVEALTDALTGVEPAERQEQQPGVWTVTGRQSVTKRLVEFLESADEEILFMTVEALLTDDVVAALRAASDRGVTVKLAGLEPSVRERLQEGVPEATQFESMWGWADTPAGRVLLVDRERTLASVLLNGTGDHPPEPRDETAIWGSGERNSLVVVLKAMFTWQVEHGD